jgi:hypothetical protein
VEAAGLDQREAAMSVEAHFRVGSARACWVVLVGVADRPDRDRNNFIMVEA